MTLRLQPEQFSSRRKLQQAASLLVAKAIKANQLKKLTGDIPCTDCPQPADRYDHRDYTRPLDVEPVCRLCNARRGKGLPLHITEWSYQTERTTHHISTTTPLTRPTPEILTLDDLATFLQFTPDYLKNNYLKWNLPGMFLLDSHVRFSKKLILDWIGCVASRPPTPHA